MKVLILETAAGAVDYVAARIAGRLEHAPETVLGLATGGTMEAVYERLIGLHRAGRARFAGATSFNLDEYVGLAPDHPCSYWRYMRERLFDHVDMDAARAQLPRGDAADPEAEAARYEAAIAAAGDVGLQLLGIGHNGHIGFNEPTSSLASLTRLKTLTRATREANSRYFARFEDTPRLAITMGIGTILRAREVLLLATGRGKAEAVAAMVEGPVTAICPASALQFHPHATAVLDAGAAAGLRLRDYYEEVHPGGCDPA